MSIALSIDPGIRGVGAALWKDNKLSKAAYIRNPEKKGNGPKECAVVAQEVVKWISAVMAQMEWRSSYYLDFLILEWPRTYAGRSAKGDTRDLFPLAGIDAALASLFIESNIIYYLPQQWKSNVNAEVMIERIKTRISEEEKANIVLPCKSLEHNVWDSIGIGLYFLNRLDRHRVYSRE